MDKNITPPKTVDHIAIAVSAVLQTLPFTGGLARYLDEYYPSQQKRLLRTLSDELCKQATKIETISCDLNVLGALVNKVMTESMKTASEQKRLAFRAILMNYAKGKQISERKLEYFMQVLSDLTELQLEILRLSVNPERCAREQRSIAHSDSVDMKAICIDDIIGSIPELSWPAYDNLVARALLKHTTWYPEKPQPKRMPLSRVAISPLGAEFLSWIETP
ncbi:MAG: hypothetical protein PHR35_16015 [Kiritimatiellae bacterium]|nr:hypothetical protein [Kiritimatiellia bacterium]